MTREEYMAKLQKYLRKLPKQDYEDAIEYFNEYFSDTDEEGQQKLMEELGTPKEAVIFWIESYRNRTQILRRKRVKKELSRSRSLQSCQRL